LVVRAQCLRRALAPAAPHGCEHRVVLDLAVPLAWQLIARALANAAHGLGAQRLSHAREIVLLGPLEPPLPRDQILGRQLAYAGTAAGAAPHARVYVDPEPLAHRTEVGSTCQLSRALGKVARDAPRRIAVRR